MKSSLYHLSDLIFCIQQIFPFYGFGPLLTSRVGYQTEVAGLVISEGLVFNKTEEDRRTFRLFFNRVGMDERNLVD